MSPAPPTISLASAACDAAGHDDLCCVERPSAPCHEPRREGELKTRARRVARGRARYLFSSGTVPRFDAGAIATVHSRYTP